VKTWLFWLGLAACLFLGFWAFAYQGYTEDSGSEPFNTWPWGAAFYGTAVLMIFMLVRRQRPAIGSGKVVVVGVILVVVGVLAALLSLDAGGHSFEF
jgi:hypothetical protein